MEGHCSVSRMSGKTPQPPAPISAPHGMSTAVGLLSAPSKPRRGSSSSSTSSSRTNRRPTAMSSSSNNSSSKSPRAPPSRSSEPATEDDDKDDDDARGQSSAEASSSTPGALGAMEKQLAQMLADVTAKSQRNQKRYTSMRGDVAGKDEQIARLHATYGSLNEQLAELEALCDGSSTDSDADAALLDRLYRSIPRHGQRVETTDA